MYTNAQVDARGADDADPELPWHIHEEIHSAHRLMAHTLRHEDRPIHFGRIARELFDLPENSDARIRQIIADEVYDLGVLGGLDDDEAQEIMAAAANEPEASREAPSSSNESSNDARPPEFSDDALALQFAKVHADDLRYVAAWGRWVSRNRTRWQFDHTLRAYDLVRETCRAASAECKKKLRALLASAKTVAAVERLSRSDRRLAATVDQWDVDPWLLNTPNGIVDLRSGKQRAHRANDYLTKITAVPPDGACQTPTWLAFLERVTAGDAELAAFLQRMAGYSLTGCTQEHALFFLFGTGANGKTTFINAITNCVGEYHRAAPIETFTDSKNERHPTDMAGLRGARLVTAVETEEGRRWAESKIKALTGGDKVAARFMRQDFFEYTPQFKLIIAGNHKPGLRSVDEAIRRRLHLVPFTVTIPPGERDVELPGKLKAELPGILVWMMQGCVDWQQRGLAPPEAVTSATATYLEGEDALAAWIDDNCERDPQAWEQSSKLFGDWATWAAKAGELVGSQRRFSERLEARGTEPQRRRDGRGFVGLRLRSTYP